MERTTEIPATDVTQCALHEATGHLYDALAEANLQDEQIPTAVFDSVEELYIATAERSVTSVKISYELEEESSSS